MGKAQSNEVMWPPLQGSYEEAVLSWHEQIEMSFRRRELEAQSERPAGAGGQEVATQSLPAVSAEPE